MKKIIIILLVLVLTLGFFDAYYFLSQNKPLFTFHSVDYKDGGTNVHYGLGYQLVEWKVLSEDEQKQTFYYKKREIRVFPFFRDVNDFDKMDKSTFKKEKSN